MTDELKKKLQGELNIRLRDILFEEIDVARGIMKSTIRKVLAEFGIHSVSIVTTNEAGKDVAAIVSFEGQVFECRFVVKSAPFEEIIPEMVK